MTCGKNVRRGYEYLTKKKNKKKDKREHNRCGILASEMTQCSKKLKTKKRKKIGDKTKYICAHIFIGSINWQQHIGCATVGVGQVAAAQPAANICSTYAGSSAVAWIDTYIHIYMCVYKYYKTVRKFLHQWQAGLTSTYTNGSALIL